MKTSWLTAAMLGFIFGSLTTATGAWVYGYRAAQANRPPAAVCEVPFLGRVSIEGERRRHFNKRPAQPFAALKIMAAKDADRRNQQWE